MQRTQWHWMLLLHALDVSYAAHSTHTTQDLSRNITDTTTSRLSTSNIPSFSSILIKNSTAFAPSTSQGSGSYISHTLTKSSSTGVLSRNNTFTRTQHSSVSAQSHSDFSRLTHHHTSQIDTTTVWFEILNETFLTTLATQPPPTSITQPPIWTVPPYTGPTDAASVAKCYASWQAYFDKLENATTTYSLSVYGTTITSTVDPEITAFVFGTTTETWRSTEIVVNGGFTLSNKFVTTDIWTATGSLPEYGAPFPETLTTRQTASYPIILNPPPQPSCALPSVVSTCQSSWLSYLNTYYPNQYYTFNQPNCPFASMASSECWSLRDKYVSYWSLVGLDYPGYSSGYINVGTLSSFGSVITEYAWPRYTSLAPSCTMGCARCAITGGTIQLLYWPATSTYDTATGPVTALVGESTLTYPTVYVSYQEIFASDSCGPVGPSVTNTIVAIPTPSLISSIYGTISLDIQPFVLPDIGYETTAFNITDLNPPIPYSIYARQPWCQSVINSYLYSHDEFNSWNTSSTFCPTTEAYRPILYLPSAILNSIDPLWATCSGDVRGAYDPPSALTPAASVAQPTLPVQATPTPPSPASTHPAPTPAPTVTSILSPTGIPEPDDGGSNSESPAPASSIFIVIPNSPLPSIPLSAASLATVPVAAPGVSPGQFPDIFPGPSAGLSPGLSPSISPDISPAISPVPQPDQVPGTSDQTIAVDAEGGTIYISGPSMSAQLTRGQQTTIQGVAISVAVDGSTIVVDAGSFPLSMTQTDGSLVLAAGTPPATVAVGEQTGFDRLTLPLPDASSTGALGASNTMVVTIASSENGLDREISTSRVVLTTNPNAPSVTSAGPIPSGQARRANYSLGVLSAALLMLMLATIAL